MKICIDCRLWGQKHTGIGRYTQNLVKELITQNPKDHFTLIMDPHSHLELKNQNYTIFPSSITHYTLIEQLALPKILKSIPADLYHFPHFNVPLKFNRHFIVTIHDLLWHEVKDPEATTLSPLKHKLKYWGYHHVVNHAVFASKTVIVPSAYVKAQLLKFYPNVDPAKIQVIYEGVDANLSYGRGMPRAYTGQPYLLYVGSLYPHKNLDFLIKAINGAFILKIISARSVFQEQLQAKVKSWGLSDKVIFMNSVSDADLALAIRGAMALVQPSLSEGFGLPGLEAMALGTPVLAAKAGAMPEIYGDAALFFDPSNQADFLKALKQLPLQRSKLIAQGLKQAKKYSWAKAATDTRSIYENSTNL